MPLENGLCRVSRGISHDRVAAERWTGRGYGRIVNVASVAGKERERNPDASAHGASKAAMIALTKSLGKETAATRSRVNCITPAAIKTTLFDLTTPQHVEFMLSKIPAGRFGTSRRQLRSSAGWQAMTVCSRPGQLSISPAAGRPTEMTSQS